MTTAPRDRIAHDSPLARADRPTTAVQKFLFGGLGAETTFGDVGLAVLRVSIGLFIALGHGWSKIHPAAGEWGPSDGFVGGVASLGFPAPLFFAWCAALTEFVGGLLLAAGLFTRWVALALMLNMGVAAFGMHLADPFFLPPGGQGGKKEPAMLYLFPFLMFAFTGGGRFSVDALLRRAGRRDPAEDVYVTPTPRAV